MLIKLQLYPYKHVCLSLTSSVFSFLGRDPAAEAEGGEGGEREEWAETQ